MSLSLNELKEYLVSKGGYTITPSHNQLADLKELVTNMMEVRNENPPATGSGYYSGTTCNEHQDVSDFKLSLGDINAIDIKGCSCDTVNNRIAYCRSRTHYCSCNNNSLTCACNSRSAATCNCQSRTSTNLGRYYCKCNDRTYQGSGTCYCDINNGTAGLCKVNYDKNVCPSHQDLTYKSIFFSWNKACTCNNYLTRPCTCNSRTPDACNCQSRTSSCGSRSTTSCSCNARCACNAEKRFS